MAPALAPLFRAVVIAAVAAMAVAAAAAAPAAAAVAAPAAAAACACPPQPPLRKSVAAFPHTLLARVTNVIRSPVPVEGDEGGELYMATVGSAFVGCTMRRIQLSTAAPAEAGGCAATLALDKKYLLFLPEADDQGHYRVTPCGPQREWDAVGPADRHMLWRANTLVCPRPKRMLFGHRQ